MQTVIKEIGRYSTAEENAALDMAADCIRQGGLVVFPTETVYGLGGNALMDTAAEKIYRAKGRPSDNPLIIHIAFPEEARLYTKPTAMYFRLAERFMPGPLTVVLEALPVIPKTVTAGLSTVAVRCPVHPVAHELIRRSGVPIAAPSANLSGSPSPTCGRHVAEDMDGRVDMILSGGDCDFGVESTIVKIEPDESLTLLRPGAVTLEDLRTVTPEVRVADAVLGALKAGETVLSPGMKYKHYAPTTPTFLLDGSPEKVCAYLLSKKEKDRVLVLTYEEDIPLLSQVIKPENLISFGKRSDQRTQAHRLFFLLREADKKGMDKIYAPLPDTNGMGMALYNRMIRAAAHQIIKL